MADAKVAGLLLAAGRGQRFGGAKLDADCAGQPLGLHSAKTLALVATAGLIAVTPPAQTPFSDALIGLGYRLVINDQPALGLAHSIGIGISHVADTGADAVLIMLGDMPHITPAHLAALIAGYDCNPRVIGTSSGAVRTPPAIFPRAVFADLQLLVGEGGAREMLAAADHVAAPITLISDVDTPEDLRTAINRLR